ncbi:DNA-binding domain-containing protein [Aliiroseovarius sp. PTFE2010]|uniref:HvfC/BufC N-terminal domain-containing protein n=1 Tax=Aliiroseovarius sp. PTFE2010 TaxID=3417190 RepID=UPI003CE92BC1
MTQHEFTQALLDPDRPPPQGLHGPGGAPAGKRFDVYRNNVAVGLTDALSSAFPVVRKLVGDEFFVAMAGVYLRIHQPKSQMMKDYGDTFPIFLQRFAPVNHLAYLPDVARIERARTRAYHAADARPIAPQAIAEIPTERLMGARLTFAPAVRTLSFKHPALSIWRANAEGAPPPRPAPEDTLIARPGFDPTCHALPPKGAAFVRSLQDGASLNLAMVAAGPGFDLTTTLSALIAGGAITGVAS